MIRQIQYLRGFAALMVVWHHALGQIDATKAFIRLPEVGMYGVDLFFVISGFIMLVTTWDKPIGPAQFMVHRIRRVVPLYWAATLVTVGAAIVAPALFKNFQWNMGALLKSLFFVPYYSLTVPDAEWPLLIPGWSLNLEMFFYVLFALTLLVGRNWRLPLMVGTLSILFIAGLIWQPKNPIADVYTSYYILEFGVGMILGRLWVMKKHQRQDGGHPVLMALGDASYSIYLSHLFVLGVLRVLWVRLVPTASLGSSIAWMSVALVGCSIAGWICFLAIERPITKRLSGRRAGVAPPIVVA